MTKVENMNTVNLRIWIAVFLMLLSVSLEAQHLGGPWGIGIGYNQRDFTKIPNKEFSSIPFNRAVRFYVGRYLNASFDLMLNSTFVPLSFSDRKKEELTDIDINLRYKLNNGYILKENALFAPYITMGFGVNMQEELQGTTNSSTPLGAGVKLNIGSMVSLEVGGKYYVNMGDFQDYASLNYGFSINFGKSKVPEAVPETPTVAPQLVQTPPPSDRDKDGVVDSEDGCPLKAGPVALRGCPDKDGDAVADKYDACPDEPGLKERNGCPAVDTDKDGVEDDQDMCPEKAGLASLFGCPDTDGDGISDLKDACPGLAGTLRMNGCPEIDAEVKKQLEKVKKAVQFESGSSILKQSSFAVLDIVVEIMKQYPAYYLRISGHTDSFGNDRKNLLLSERRAKACLDYLVSQGVIDGRIAYGGYGEERPLASNDTWEGRAENRRVEFELLIPDEERR